MAQPGLTVEVTGGSDRGGSIALGFRPTAADTGTFLWADADLGLGVGMARGWRQVRAGGGFSGTVGGLELRVFALGYDGVFESPGVLLAEEVDAGVVDFYDAYPGSGGGRSQRAVAAVTANAKAPDLRVQSTLWASARRLALEQNYTGQYTLPGIGDGSLQEHDALSGGAVVRVESGAGHHLDLRAGLDARVDAFTQRENGIDVEGQAFEERLDVMAQQFGVGGWSEAAWRPTDWLDVIPGMRVQVFGASLDRRLDFGLGTGKVAAAAPAVAPRGRVVLFPQGPFSAYVRAARGLRSPEARGLESGRAPVVLTDSVEASASYEATGGEVRGGAFGTWVGNEIVFDHAAARFETAGATRRLGVFAGGTARPWSGVELELDVTASDGRISGTGDPIPYAPRFLVVGQARTDGVEVGPLVWNVGARTWWLSRRPLPQGFASTAPTVTDLTMQAVHRRWTFDLDISNLFATRWRDGEFQYASDWRPEDDQVSALPQRHFTAGAPFAARIGIGFRGW